MSRFHRYSGPGDPSTADALHLNESPGKLPKIPVHLVGDLHLPEVSPFTGATPLLLLYPAFDLLTHLHTLNVHFTPIVVAMRGLFPLSRSSTYTDFLH